MEIRLAVPDKLIDERTINAALEATTRANEALARRGHLPDIREAIRGGVRWRPEPWIGERFDLAPTVLARGWGDCDDLGPWLAAQMRSQGRQARAFARRSGANKWHVQVEDERGQIHDPSIWAGMPSRGQAPARELARPQKPLTVSGGSAICGLPWQGKWHVRADLPWGEDAHVAGWSVSDDPEEAFLDALASYCLLTEGCYGIGDIGASTGLADLVDLSDPLTYAARGKPAPSRDGGPMASRIKAVTRALWAPPGAPKAPAAPAAPEPAGEDKEGAPAPPEHGQADEEHDDAPELAQEDAPEGWPRAARTYAIPGPGGYGAGRVTCGPGAGCPILVRF